MCWERAAPACPPAVDWHPRGSEWHQQCLTTWLGTGATSRPESGRPEDRRSELKGARASSPSALDCAHRCGCTTPTRLWGPRETKSQGWAAAQRQRLLWCVRGLRFHFLHTENQQPSRKGQTLLECVKHVYSQHLVQTKEDSMRLGPGWEEEGEDLSPCAGAACACACLCSYTLTWDCTL